MNAKISLYGAFNISGTVVLFQMKEIIMAKKVSRPKWESVEVGGRKIRIATDRLTQSINICTAANRWGEYEEVHYFSPNYRWWTAAEINRYRNLDTLRKELRRRARQQCLKFPCKK